MLELFGEILDGLLRLYETVMCPLVIIGLIAIAMLAIPSVITTLMAVAPIMCTPDGMVCLVLFLFSLTLMR